ncbi:MAG TPA: histidine kinase [Chitinophagaceae bacterium]
MNTKKRYGFWKVFWVLLGLYLLLAFIGVITISVTPAAAKEIEVQEIFSLYHFLTQAISLSFSVVFYYFAMNAYYRLIEERKPTIDYIRVSVLWAVILTLYYIGYYQLQDFDEKVKQQLTTGLMIMSIAFSSLFKIGTALIIPYFTYLSDERKQRKVLEEQKLQLEVEKSQANFNFLKAQINPHFLHNTLNFLYSKSLPYSAELSEGILTLSDIMRYALSAGNTKDGKALLKDEIEHMRNVIKINQLRFSNSLYVEFEVEGVVNGATIIPFVLITLVENAFKHGDLKSPEHPIRIRLVVEGKTLRFYCRNRKKQGPKELSTGIGLENIKNQLHLAYGKNYTFKVKEDDEFYTTELTINQL